MPSRDVGFLRPGASWRLALVFLLVLAWGCTASKNTDAQEAPGRSGCFRCHEESLRAQPVHKRHSHTGLRCLQCHSYPQDKGHGGLKGNTCLNCHNLREFPLGSADKLVWFDHARHMKTYPCKTCHMRIFQMKRGSTPITMKAMRQGLYCGGCHNGKTAFSLRHCSRCHQ